MKRSRIPFETRILLSALAVGLPGTVVALVWIVSGPLAPVLKWTLSTLLSLVWFALAWSLRSRIVFSLYTVSNLLEALREGDFSLRGSRGTRGDAMGDVIWEINTLSQTLREHRLKAEEASALLSKVITEIDIAVMSFDGERRLRLINPAGERLLARRANMLLGRSAFELGLADCFDIEVERVEQRSFDGASGRFGIRHYGFRESGLPHHLLVITDLSRALRDEERQAWQRLIRVLGHELNNSLTPIRSMSETLKRMLSRDPLPPDWREDVGDGLHVIGERAAALSRFMSAYSTLARLPAPRRTLVDVEPLLQRVVRLEQRKPVRLEQGPAVQVELDADQIEQALINLVKNAVDATLETEGGVSLRWAVEGASLLIEILDEGPGLASSDNLFVPFYTTKPGGSGIGLALARQIVEGHAGYLNLTNRGDRSGCVARLRLPL
jgi:two-component system nitrogen regulation sensor histidine kinase NtrY